MSNRRILHNAKLNKFDLSHVHTTTGDMGWLYPVACIEALPNDWFRIKDEFLVRFLALISPTMHMFNVKLHWWYAPSRLAYEDFQSFITGGEKGEDNSTPPYVIAPEGGFAPGSLMNRLGAPANVAGIKCSAIPPRLYQLICNEWYRNEWIQDPVEISLAGGEDTTTSLELRKALWQRDYFTRMLPSPQKGPEVLLPLGGAVPVVGNGLAMTFTDGTNEGSLGHYNMSGVSALQAYKGMVGKPLGTPGTADANELAGAMGLSRDAATSGVVADLSKVPGVSINTIRRGSAVQQFQEAAGLFGSRYSEMIPSQYGTYCPDASLQRPQYLGGSSAPVMISQVLQTSATNTTSPQGNMAGHAVSAGLGHEIRFHSREFGFLFCIMSIMPKTAYFQGIPRFMSRETRFDYAIPLLAHIGEMGVKNKELYAQGNEDDDKIAGYVPQYDDYRSIPDTVSGQMVSTLKFWTAAREFENLPTLSPQFIEANPTDRIFAVDSERPNSDHLVFQVAHHIKALRPLPKQGIAGMHVI